MAHVITALCLRDGACVDVCPVECIIGGKPEAEWNWFFIDPNTCIDCGACVPECPFEAIFPLDEVPAAYQMKPGQKIAPFQGEAFECTGEEVYDLTDATAINAAFFTEGPGYAAKNM